MADIKELLKQGTDRLLIGFGAVLIFLSLFRLIDIKKLDLQPQPPSYLTLVLGILFVIAGIGFHLVEAGIPVGLWRSGIAKESNGCLVRIGQADIAVVFGQLENAALQHQDAIVLLPANEFFDDECMQDSKSSLGAFVLKHLGGRIHELRELLAVSLRSYKTEFVEKEQGHNAASFGVGACVYLENPLKTQWRLLFAAVTTKRAKQGLQASSQDVMRVVREAGCKMADFRVDKLILPIIGSGHGGLSREAALTCILIAFVELARSPIGRGLRRITIVVFQQNEKSHADLSKRQVRRALALARSCCE